MVEFLALSERQKNDPKFKTIACEEWHHTCIDELEKLNTAWFCPKCNLPVTEAANSAHNKMLEALGEESMRARDQILRTWEYVSPLQIPLDGSRFQVVRVWDAVMQVLV